MMSTTLVVMLTFVLEIVLSEGRIELPVRHCEKLCGIKANISTIYQPIFPLRRRTLSYNSCPIGNDDLTSWVNSSRRFLASIGMNVSARACSAVHTFEPPPNLQNVFRNGLSNTPYFGEVTGRVTGEENFWRIRKLPKDIQAICYIRADRGVLRRNSSESDSGKYTTDWLVSHRYLARDGKGNLSPLGRLFAFFSDGTGEVRSITLPSETVPYSLFWQSSNHQNYEKRYSMFADWKLEQIPWMSYILEDLGNAVTRLENMVYEISPSNIAILCLPLLMAIPPVSILESVSDTATAWYVFATDVLATVPLLIKGIELIVEQHRAKTELFIRVSLTDGQYGIFERWYVSCQPVGAVQRVRIGAGLVGTALYFMVASIYAEFLFWRAMKYRQGLRKKMDDIDVEEIVTDETHVNQNNIGTSCEYSEFLFWRAKKHHEGCSNEVSAMDIGRTTLEEDNVNANNSTYAKFLSWRTMRYRKRRLEHMDMDDSVETQMDEEKADQPTRLRTQIQVGIIRKVLIMLLSIGVLVAFVFAMKRYGEAVIVIPILLVLMRAVATERLYQFLRWKFWAGIAFGFVGGPIYLLLHVLEKVRKSESWGEVSDGSSIGLSALVLTLTSLFAPSYTSFSFVRTALSGTLFALFFCCSLFLVNMIRSTSEERIGWRYGVHGFMSGLVFGPFGFLFSRCFPEMRRKERGHFFGGFAFGLVVITFAVTLTFFFVNYFISSKGGIR